jgi:hypothetical protein
VSRLGELTTKVDEFFARVTSRHGTDMQCDTGCSDCCHVRLTVTRVEAAAIRSLVATWSNHERQRLADVAAADHCAALDGAGRCKIYDARPVVCRSHGVPIRLRQGGLPVVQACHRNFRITTPDPDCVLDQTTLSATLLAINAAEARPAPAPIGAAPAPAAPAPAGAAPAAGERVELSSLLAELAAI